jgi:hypothetical protein
MAYDVPHPPGRPQRGVEADALPEEHRGVVEQALKCYRSTRVVSAQERGTDGHGWDLTALESFKQYVS